MEITGKIISVLPASEGVSRMGNKWKKQEYVLETQEQYSKKVCFGLFGSEKIDQAAIKEGEVVTVHFDIESREFNGKWYTSINGWKVDRSSASATSDYEPPTMQTYHAASLGEPVMMPDYPPPGPVDDIPF
jgi:hypothetical protein